MMANFLPHIVGEDVIDKMITPVNADGADVEISGHDKKLNLKMTLNGKTIAELKDYAIVSGNLMREPVQDYKVLLTCFDETCNLIFYTVCKLDEKGENFTFNRWGMIKTVNGQYVRARLRKKETYKKEYEARLAQATAAEQKNQKDTKK
jgi:hypothetical protein